MTDERHRAEDVYQEVAALRADLPKIICDNVKETIKAGDFELPDGSSPGDLLDEHDGLSLGIDRIVSVLEGPLVDNAFDVSGYPVREHDAGLVSKVDKIYEGVNGGNGMKVKRIWTTEQRAVYISIAATWTAAGLAVIVKLIGG